MLAVLSPHYDIMTSYHNVTAQWLIVNTVLKVDKTINVKAGEEWLSYKIPKARIKQTNKTKETELHLRFYIRIAFTYLNDHTTFKTLT